MMSYIAAVYAISATAVLAQDVAGGDNAGWMIDLVTNVGIGAVFIWIWFDERKERRAAQAKVNDLMERIIPALTESTATLERVQESMTKVSQAQGSVQRNEMDSLKEAVQALTTAVQERPPPRSR